MASITLDLFKKLYEETREIVFREDPDKLNKMDKLVEKNIEMAYQLYQAEVEKRRIHLESLLEK